MAITWQDVVNIAPELADAPSATQAASLALAAKLTPADTWDTMVDEGRAYLAAHLATISARQGAGAVTSESVGGLSRSYESLLSLAGTFGQTSYGTWFSKLCRFLPDAAAGLTI